MINSLSEFSSHNPCYLEIVYKRLLYILFAPAFAVRPKIASRPFRECATLWNWSLERTYLSVLPARIYQDSRRKLEFLSCHKFSYLNLAKTRNMILDMALRNNIALCVIRHFRHFLYWEILVLRKCWKRCHTDETSHSW